MTDPKPSPQAELERLLDQVRRVAERPEPPPMPEPEPPKVLGKPRIEIFSFDLDEETGADMAKAINDRIDVLLDEGGGRIQPSIYAEGGRLVVVIFYVQSG